MSALKVSMGRLARFRLRCDCCGEVAPDVVGPILCGHYGWREFAIDDVYEGRRWEARVLLCGRSGFDEGGCAPRMQAFIDGTGPRVRIVTVEGGKVTEAEFAARVAALPPAVGDGTREEGTGV